MTNLGALGDITKSSYWLCVGLLVVSSAGEWAFLAQLPASLRSLDRVLFVAGVLVGVLLFSNFARYVGAALLALLASIPSTRLWAPREGLSRLASSFR
jgi:hypothetical protein